MVQVSMPRGAPLAVIAMLALAAVVLVIAVLYPAAQVLMALLAVLVLGLGSVAAVSYRAERRRPAVRPARLPGPVAQRSVQTAPGVTRQALVVPHQGADDLQLVLTVEGYQLVNDRGEVVYTLKR
jgi:hypothetical protein